MTTKESPAHSVLVEHAMTKKVIVASEDSSLNHATKLMSEHQIRHLVVVDSNRVPKGVFSDRDLLKFLANELASGKRISSQMSVKRLMKPWPETVLPSMPLKDAAGILNDRKIGCLLVVNEHGHLRGILTRGNVLRYFAERH